MKPQTLFLAILSFFTPLTLNAQVLEQDSLALVAFYNSTGGPNWNDNSNWLTGPVSTWYGVTVEDNRVTELLTYSNNLIGVLPNGIGELNYLKKITLSNNPGLSGNIIEDIFNIDSLTWLAIGNCALSGTIPNSIGNCAGLKSISFRENNLTGPIPSEIGSLDSLRFLYLYDNQLTGHIPPELANCDSLQELLLNDNQLDGSIPPELAGLSKLYRLYLQNNQLTGSLPENFCEFFLYPDDFSLSVSNNKLGDSLPESWGNLNLIIGSLDISGNHFNYIPPVTSNCHWEGTFFHIEENKLPYEYIEPHYQYNAFFYFYYYPQQFLLEEIDTLLPQGSNYWIYSGTKGEYTYYEWRHNSILIAQGPDMDTLFLENISYKDTGIYYCHATNSLIGNMTLRRNEVHIGIDTGANIIDRSFQRSFRVYPNPASDEITIEIPCKREAIHINISNIQGKCILKKVYELYGNPLVTININELMPGIYLLHIQTETKTYATKFIKNKRGINR